MDIFQASLEDIEELSTLFDQYRVFYQSISNPLGAKNFLHARLQQRDSVIFAARIQSQISGFTQLYPSFSSISMGRIWILNDLFVDEHYRRIGVAESLMGTAENFARESDGIRIELSTEISNVTAQSLYRKRGYIQDREFYHYQLAL